MADVEIVDTTSDNILDYGICGTKNRRASASRAGELDVPGTLEQSTCTLRFALEGEPPGEPGIWEED